MMYTVCKYPDKTELTVSNIRKKDNGDEYIIVCFERPTKEGFDTIIFELPSYKVIREDGHFSDEEIDKFNNMVHRSAHIFFGLAREGGIKFA